MSDATMRTEAHAFFKGADGSFVAVRTGEATTAAAPLQSVLNHRVRYHETDPQGFFFNSRYLELADVGLTEFFRVLGHPYEQLVASGVDPSVVKVEATFRRPARFDDELVVSTTCTRVGRSSFELTTVVSRAGETTAELSLTYVNVDVASASSSVLPDSIAEALRAAAVPAAASTS
jgi:acyl-CoA thioester hydrolase